MLQAALALQAREVEAEPRPARDVGVPLKGSCKGYYKGSTRVPLKGSFTGYYRIYKGSFKYPVTLTSLASKDLIIRSLRGPGP